MVDALATAILTGITLKTDTVQSVILWVLLIMAKITIGPRSSFGSVQEPEDCRLLILSPARLIFFLRIDDNNWDRIHSPLTSAHCFVNGYVGK